MNSLSRRRREESLGDEGSTKSVASFSLDSSLLEGMLEGRGLEDSLGIPSVASLDLLDELVSGEEEEGEEFWKKP